MSIRRIYEAIWRPPTEDAGVPSGPIELRYPKGSAVFVVYLDGGSFAISVHTSFAEVVKMYPAAAGDTLAGEAGNFEFTGWTTQGKKGKYTVVEMPLNKPFKDI